jgi:hypothetical protein
MLFTDPSSHTERLTPASTSKLLASDSIARHQDCGWHCATGYKDGHVQVTVYADTKAELDTALGVRAETPPVSFALAPRGRRTRQSVH